MNHCIVGSSPSSGSSLLADLLDSAPAGTCGPELGLFCASDAYDDYEAFKRDPKGRGISRGYYRACNRFKMHRLPYYGLTESDFRRLANEASNLPELAELLGHRFFALRGKKEGVWFEKTPENIQFADRFLAQFPQGKFIHVVRNPLYVARSLVRRGFSPVSAWLAWWFEVVCVASVESDRLRTIRYEELTASPFPMVGELLVWAGLEPIEPDVLERQYRGNRYRQITSNRIKTWQNTEVGGDIVSANKGDIPIEVLAMCKKLMGFRPSDEWSNRMKIPALALADLLEKFGYLDSVREQLAQENVVADAKWTAFEWKEFIFRGLQRFRSGGRRNLALRLFEPADQPSVEYLRGDD